MTDSVPAKAIRDQATQLLSRIEAGCSEADAEIAVTRACADETLRCVQGLVSERNGFRTIVAVVGVSNIGKSSLINDYLKQSLACDASPKDDAYVLEDGQSPNMLEVESTLVTAADGVVSNFDPKTLRHAYEKIIHEPAFLPAEDRARESTPIADAPAIGRSVVFTPDGPGGALHSGIIVGYDKDLKEYEVETDGTDTVAISLEDAKATMRLRFDLPFVAGDVDPSDEGGWRNDWLGFPDPESTAKKATPAAAGRSRGNGSAAKAPKPPKDEILPEGLAGDTTHGVTFIRRAPESNPVYSVLMHFLAAGVIQALRSMLEEELSLKPPDDDDDGDGGAAAGPAVGSAVKEDTSHTLALQQALAMVGLNPETHIGKYRQDGVALPMLPRKFAFLCRGGALSLRYTPNTGSHARDRARLAAFMRHHFDCSADGVKRGNFLGLHTGLTEVFVPLPLPPRLVIADCAGITDHGHRRNWTRTEPVCDVLKFEDTTGALIVAGVGGGGSDAALKFLDHCGFLKRVAERKAILACMPKARDLVDREDDEVEDMMRRFQECNTDTLEAILSVAKLSARRFLDASIPPPAARFITGWYDRNNDNMDVHADVHAFVGDALHLCATEDERLAHGLANVARAEKTRQTHCAMLLRVQSVALRERSTPSATARPLLAGLGRVQDRVTAAWAALQRDEAAIAKRIMNAVVPLFEVWVAERAAACTTGAVRVAVAKRCPHPVLYTDGRTGLDANATLNATANYNLLKALTPKQGPRGNKAETVFLVMTEASGLAEGMLTPLAHLSVDADMTTAKPAERIVLSELRRYLDPLKSTSEDKAHGVDQALGVLRLELEPLLKSEARCFLNLKETWASVYSRALGGKTGASLLSRPDGPLKSPKYTGLPSKMGVYHSRVQALSELGPAFARDVVAPKYLAELKAVLKAKVDGLLRAIANRVLRQFLSPKAVVEEDDGKAGSSVNPSPNSQAARPPPRSSRPAKGPSLAEALLSLCENDRLPITLLAFLDSAHNHKTANALARCAESAAAHTNAAHAAWVQALRAKRGAPPPSNAITAAGQDEPAVLAGFDIPPSHYAKAVLQAAVIFYKNHSLVACAALSETSPEAVSIVAKAAEAVQASGMALLTLDWRLVRGVFRRLGRLDAYSGPDNAPGSTEKALMDLGSKGDSWGRRQSLRERKAPVREGVDKVVKDARDVAVVRALSHAFNVAANTAVWSALKGQPRFVGQSDLAAPRAAPKQLAGARKRLLLLANSDLRKVKMDKIVWPKFEDLLDWMEGMKKFYGHAADHFIYAKADILSRNTAAPARPQRAKRPSAGVAGGQTTRASKRKRPAAGALDLLADESAKALQDTTCDTDTDGDD